jgi:deoxyribonuclease-4
MKIGAHVSTSGGLFTAVDRAEEIGAETIQIFASSPRAWRFRPHSSEDINLYKDRVSKSNVSPLFIHCSYLVNVAGSDDILGKSISSLKDHMDAASRIGAMGVIFHGGSHKGIGFDRVFEQAVLALKEVLESSPNDVLLVIENSAGMGSHIGSSFAEIGRIVRELESPQFRVCLDTQHSFAAGYNLAEYNGLNETMHEFHEEVGLSKLVAVHANDSKIVLGGGVDRHENIGEGYIGLPGFETIISHPAFNEVPFLLEVPGMDGNGPDKTNLDLLKKIRSETGVSA